MPPQSHSATQLLARMRAGDTAAPEALFAAVYEELRRLARQVRGGRAGDTLRTTALVHEAYVKLTSGNAPDYEGRLHFFRTAARAMRQILTDAARRRLADKRGGGLPTVTFDEGVHAAPVDAERLLALDEAIDRLEALDPRAAQVVECRFFAGLSVEETAVALDISPRTVKRDWRAARAFLADDLEPAGD